MDVDRPLSKAAQRLMKGEYERTKLRRDFQAMPPEKRARAEERLGRFEELLSDDEF